MYSAFTYPKLLRGGTNRRPFLQDIQRQTLGPLLHVSFQSTTLPVSCWSILCRQAGEYVPFCGTASILRHSTGQQDKSVQGRPKAALNLLFSDHFGGAAHLSQISVFLVVPCYQGGDLSLYLFHLRMERPGGQPQRPMSQNDHLLQSV